MNWLSQIKTWLLRYEPLLFWCCAAVFIIPLWLSAGIYTYDGPAHLYNARQLWEMLFQNNRWLYEFYSLNTGPDNWLVHGMLMCLQAAFGAVLAEKIWFTLYVLLFVLGFRKWMLFMQQIALSWWVFLLPYFFNVMLGQYSFALSVALFPFFMLYWQRFLASAQRKDGLWVGILLLLLYLTHVVSFGVAGLAAGLLSLLHPADVQFRLKKLGQLALLALPGLVLTVVFMHRNGQDAVYVWLSLAERWSYIHDFRALIVYSYEADLIWTRLVAVSFAILLLVGLWNSRSDWKPSRAWGLIWLVVLLLNLIAPDQAAGGGFIQTRLNILFVMVSIALLASFSKMKLWYAYAAPLLLLLALRLGAGHLYAHHQLAKSRQDWVLAERVIPAQSTVVTYNFSPLWLHHHIHTLIGQHKAVVHSSNYEADNNYFPLRWQQRPELHDWLQYWVATKSLSPCGPETVPAEKYLPDYIICYFHEIGKTPSCTQSLEMLLAKHYTAKPVFTSGELQVYQRR